MTMAMRAVNMPAYTGPKVLRIGVISAGKIVEERIIRKRETVTVGSSEKNHFVLPGTRIGPRFEMFVLRGQDYFLQFTDEMDGRVSTPAGVQDFRTLRQSGQAKKQGATWLFPLSDQSRGKVTVGEATLLFQFVTPPPVRPKPQLPAAARGGWVKNIDWLYAAFVMFSYVLHFGVVIWTQYQDWPVESGWESVPDRYAEFIMEDVPQPQQEQVQQGQGDEEPTKDEETKQEPTKHAKAGPVDAEAAARAAAERRARLTEQMARLGINQVITSLTGEGGVMADVLRGGSVGGDLDDIMAQVRGVGVQSGEGGGALRAAGGGGDGAGSVAGLDGLRAAGGDANVDGGQAAPERQIRGRVRSTGGDAIGGSGVLDAGEVRHVINSRIAAIKMCYERQLRRNPTLEGRITIQFTIGGAGTVTSASATENTLGDAEVGSCVASTFRRFRFTPPEGGSVTFSFPFVFQPSG
jgi:TonB family protein